MTIDSVKNWQQKAHSRLNLIQKILLGEHAAGEKTQDSLKQSMNAMSRSMPCNYLCLFSKWINELIDIFCECKFQCWQKRMNVKVMWIYWSRLNNNFWRLKESLIDEILQNDCIVWPHLIKFNINTSWYSITYSNHQIRNETN